MDRIPGHAKRQGWSFEGCKKTRNDDATAPLFWLTTCGHPLRDKRRRRRRRSRAAATAATVFREGEGELKAEVMSGPEEEEGEKAKGGVMAVKGPTVLVSAN